AVQGDDVLGDRQRDARAAHFRGVHVAVDPRGGAQPVGIGADLEQPQVPSLRALADARDAHQVRMGASPTLHDMRQFLVAQITVAKHQRARDASPMIPNVRRARASPAIRPPPISDMLSMSAGARVSLRFMVAFQSQEKMPPTPYQSAVGNSTKPPRLEA